MLERKERVLLVGVDLPRRNEVDPDESLEELASLARTAGGEVVGKVIQKRTRIDPATYIGKGKALEIASLCKAQDIDLIVFDEDLSPAQASNLEKVTGVRVIDRSQLILDIFSLGARTNAAKAQVELAQLEYTLPRLKRMWEHLSRTGGGIGTRGPGETQLEVDRRRIRRRIYTLKRILNKIEQDRSVRTARRRRWIRVSIVGYTNTGKSTLFNRLTKASVAVGDRLFETLDATTRILRLPRKEFVLLSDTVGFIRKLPHHLIASFHATLECVVEADLILHVVDVTSRDYEAQMRAVKGVLEEIGATGKPEIVVFNKVDLAQDTPHLNHALRTHEGAIAVSAQYGWGIDTLKEEILRFVLSRKREVKLSVPGDDGAVLSYVRKYGTILSHDLVEGGSEIVIRIEEKYLRPLESYISEIRMPRELPK